MSLSVKNFGGGGSIGSVENLLVPTLGTTTLNGVTCTNNGDGTYTLNGTATARCIFKLASPFGIASGTYKLVLTNVYNGGLALTVAKTNYASGEVGYVRTEGNVTISENITAYIHINVVSGTTLDNLIVKPMLTTNLKATYKEFVKRVGGFTNVMPSNFNAVSSAGVTASPNGDGTITLNGTSTANGELNLLSASMSYNGTYKLTGTPVELLGTGVYLQMYSSSTGTMLRERDTLGAIGTLNASDFDLRIKFSNNYTFNNLVFKPMLTESLLPEYFDFVKGVADGITPQMFGCTSMVKSTFTPTSEQQLITIGTIPHNLGSRPKVLFMGIRDQSKYTSSGNSLRWWLLEGTVNNYSYMIGFRASSTGAISRITASASGLSLNENYILITGNTTSTGGMFLIGGQTYDIIAMA